MTLVSKIKIGKAQLTHIADFKVNHNSYGRRSWAMTHYHTILRQMLQMFSGFKFQKVFKQTKTEYRAHSLMPWNHFVSMLLSQLSDQNSLRGIDAGLAKQARALYHAGVRPVHRTTLA